MAVNQQSVCGKGPCSLDCVEKVVESSETSSIKSFQFVLNEYKKCLETGQCLCRKFINQLDQCCNGKPVLNSVSIYQDEECFGSRSRSSHFVPRCRSKKKKCGQSNEKSKEVNNDDINCIDSCCDAKKPLDSGCDDGAKDSCCDEIDDNGDDSVDSCCDGNSEVADTKSLDSCGGDTKPNREVDAKVNDSCCGGGGTADELDSCCDDKVESGCKNDPMVKDSCCTGKANPQTCTKGLNPSDLDSCCGQDELDDEPDKDLDSCCDDGIAISSPIDKFNQNTMDLESQSMTNHVFLKVEGMTCTGCSKKIQNVLNKIDSIIEINPNFVTGTVDFKNLNSNVCLDEIINKLVKSTGFRFDIINHDRSDLQVLEINSKLPLHDLEFKLKDHIYEIESIGKSKGKASFIIKFNPQLIGARDLLSKIDDDDSDYGYEKNWELSTPKDNSNDGINIIHSLLKCIISLVLAIPVCVLSWSNPENLNYKTKSIIQLTLASIIQLISIKEFYIGAIRELFFSHVLEMDMLIVISISAAYFYSLVIFIMKHVGINTASNEEIFETSSLLISLVLIGRFLSNYAKIKAKTSVSIKSLQVQNAILLEGNNQIEIDSRLIQLNDKIIIPSHSRIVTDGIVIQGSSSIDESMITGESIPVPKNINDQVIAGTLNGSGNLIIMVTRLPGQNSINDISKLVESAMSTKPKSQELADLISSYFIPVVITIGFLVFIIWIIIGLKLQNNPPGKSISQAITYCITTLAISCPCAIGLAVPMVLVITCGVLAKNGIIVKSSKILENTFKITDIVFDKTGTLTNNRLNVEFLEILVNNEINEIGIKTLIKKMTQNNEHPVSKTISEFLSKFESTKVEILGIKDISGQGITAKFPNGSILKLGNLYWTKQDSNVKVIDILNKGLTSSCLTINDELVAIIGLRSQLVPNALKTINHFQKLGIVCHIVSGDHKTAVEDVANSLGISQKNIKFRSTPSEKQEYIKNLKIKDSKKIILFCGDGTNDSVAIAESDIGVQIGTTSDLTNSVSEVVLLNGIEGLINLYNYSKKSFNRIIFNFIWSGFYNLFAILLACGAFVKIKIPPAYAGLGELVSVLPVIFAALTIYWGRSDLKKN
ncbi:Cu2+-exporting ATPase [Wickerhamomyces ciferrii]|uniref:Cu2+-exporting ATPase n=1 Tax=Wickerhamomyces ciferrii (strain ATCC 14091 / BCRC 22168 / CBS 111 / JCM 3599 / NBRC 0793 / NRRL Y-1031 F-60-10) TaxID=1206466 RepID=K0KRP8_WICCF|nr:Cu2+-exporting ATPase [Wickerhamomyces ciferrii]CCH43999.1 Cu2+-exporting ATPase [Wickerhamomyces ciferrii]